MTELKLSFEAQQELANLADRFELSLSDIFEHIIQSKLAIIDAEGLEDLLDARDAITAEANPDNQERMAWEDVKQELGL